jgi:cell division protein FtsB
VRRSESRSSKRGSAKPRAAREPKRSSASGSGGSGGLRDNRFLRKFYRHQAEISDNAQKFLFFLVISTVLYVFVFGDAGAIRIMTLKHKKAKLEKEIATLEHNVETLKEEIDRLEDDPLAMEELGRDYGLIYPGDRVYKLIHPQETK